MAAARALDVGKPRELRMFREGKDFAISVMVKYSYYWTYLCLITLNIFVISFSALNVQGK
ncbi:hypothetical protein DPMN_068264 [Dreissena polymorpha]|uniref:Uncharacterized protein n=1 Tax=Dreissena polymorpha TaxID=45954 RepID=A0A9D3Z1B9_DREPO|nr:hypothetical protein DPMN_068264 [Dreissena polymorpha]